VIRQAEQVNATAPANTGVPVSAALRPHPRQVVVVNVVLLDELGVSDGGRQVLEAIAPGDALRGGLFGLPPRRARLLPLEPDEQTLAREADNAAAAEHGRRGVL
jgi:hypothetical protein